MTNENVEFTRPIDLTDSQVKDLTMGRSFEVGEHSRPRALTDKDVDALSTGKDIGLENFLTVEPLAIGAERMISESVENRPRALTDKDVEALSAGKDIKLEKRDKLKAQQL